MAESLPFAFPAVQMALEEYLKQVRETWTSYTLDLVQYQNKCRLIK
jgi:dynein heavy chain 1